MCCQAARTKQPQVASEGNTRKRRREVGMQRGSAWLGASMLRRIAHELRREDLLRTSRIREDLARKWRTSALQAIVSTSWRRSWPA